MKLMFWKMKYRQNAVISHFIARDVRRDVKIINVEKIDDGIVTAQIRTNNILYTSKGLMGESDYGDPQEYSIDHLWKWSGASWGGLPDGTSLANGIIHNPAQQGDASEPPSATGDP